MSAVLLLFADVAAAQAADPAKDPMGGFFSSPLPVMLLVLAGMWFFIILPSQRKEKKQRETILSSLKKNDEVLTSSGFIGTVANLREGEDEVTIKLDDNCKVRMKKSSIVQILKAKEEPKPTP
jgi:preprotein translocase subunit YajC